MGRYKYKNDNRYDQIQLEIDKTREIAFSDNISYSEQEKLQQNLENLGDKLKEEHWNEFISFAQKLDRKVRMEVQIESTTKTVEILDKFVRSDDIFLILKDHVYFDFNERYASIIVAEGSTYFGTKKAVTFTDLKQIYGKNVNNYLNISSSKKNNMYSLMQQFDDLDNSKFYRKQGEHVILFKEPFGLYGQTSIDRFGYGYGEASSFLILGVIL